MATANELRAMVVAKLRSEIGYTSGDYNYSKFGKASTWRSPWLGGVREWQGMYCGRFASWGPDAVMGARAAVAALGLQGYAIPAGWAATWFELAWAKLKGRIVKFEDAKPADRVLFKLPGRPLNPTNHIGTFVRWHIPGKVMVVVEGNLPRPGYGKSTIGVWEHYRDATYVVAIHSPDYEAAAKIYNAENPGKETPKEEDELSAAEVKEIKDHIDKLRAERTNAHVLQMKVLTRISDQLNVVGRIAAEARTAARAVPAAVVAYRVPFKKGTSAYKTFGKNFRFGALLAYGAQAFYRRGEHTEEIVEALEEAIDVEALASDVQTLDAELVDVERQGNAATAEVAALAAVETQEED